MGMTDPTYLQCDWLPKDSPLQGKVRLRVEKVPVKEINPASFESQAINSIDANTEEEKIKEWVKLIAILGLVSLLGMAASSGSGIIGDFALIIVAVLGGSFMLWGLLYKLFKGQ
jgi:hypothetical protein